MPIIETLALTTHTHPNPNPSHIMMILIDTPASLCSSICSIKMPLRWTTLLQALRFMIKF